MSVFDKYPLDDSWKVSSATRNITKWEDGSYAMNTNITYEKGNDEISIASVYAINDDQKIDKTVFAKITITHSDMTEFLNYEDGEPAILNRDRLRALREGDFTVRFIKDLNIINDLFESIDSKTKRVYL